jgi:alpha-N-arabinofuranosidase
MNTFNQSIALAPITIRLQRLRRALMAIVLAISFSALVRAESDTPVVIRVDASKRLNPISPMLYGQFAEFMFENIKGGLWAELLQNRGFEREAPLPSACHYWERYPDNRNHDPGLYFDGEEFGLSDDGYPAQSAGRAQLLVCTTRQEMPRGIYQAGIPIRPGIPYKGSIWLKGISLRNRRRAESTNEPFRGSIRVGLERDTSGGTVYAHAELTDIKTSWKRFEFELRPTTGDPLARFTIQIDGRGAVWVDQVSLIPGDARHGMRAHVLEKVAALRPAFIRWPGGNVAQDYHWQWGRGARDIRPTWVNMSWADDPEPGDFGTPEFIRLCREVGAEPNIVVNVEGRGATLAEAEKMKSDGKDIRLHSRPATAEEAAAWVEYCNGPVTSKHGALRAKDGHAEPFNVKYWEIGNEIWGDWVRGHSDAATYTKHARRYIRAMKAIDPTIKIIAVGDNDMQWNRTVLREIGPEIDLLAIHHYYGEGTSHGDRLNLMAKPLWYEKFYDDMRAIIRELVPGRDIKLAINEWNTTFVGSRQHSLEPAVFGARLMNVFERQGDLIAMSAVSDLVNGWSGGIIQASRHRVFTTPTYSVIEAYNRHRGDYRIACDVECSETYDPPDRSLGEDIPAIDAVASTSAQGDQIFLKFVNTSLDTDLSARIDVAGIEAGLEPKAEVVTITGPSLEAANSFENPAHVTARNESAELNGSTLTMNFGKHSVTLLRFEVQRSGTPNARK